MNKVKGNMVSVIGDEISDNIDIQIEYIKKYDLKQIDIRYISNQNISELSKSHARKIKEKLDENGIRVLSIVSPFGKKQKVFWNYNTIAEMKNLIEMASIFDCNYIRIFSGVDDKTKFIFKDAVFCIKELSKLISSSNIILLIENEPGTLASNPKNLLRLLKEIDSSNVRCLFDIGNFIRAGIDVIDAYELLESFIEIIHVNNADIERQTTVMLEDNNRTLKQLLKKANDLGYDGYYSLEPHHDYLKTLNGMLKEELFDKNITTFFKLITEVK